MSPGYPVRGAGAGGDGRIPSYSPRPALQGSPPCPRRRGGTAMLSGLCLIAALGLTSADEKFTVKFAESKKGDRVAVTNETTENDVIKVIDEEGGSKEEKKDKVTTRNYRETVLEKPEGKRATKLQRDYEKARVKENGKERTLAYEGKTVLIEKRGNEYEFKVDGKQLAGKDAAEATKEINE